MSKKEVKKQGGGKQNAVRFGDVGAAIEKSREGVARKRALERGRMVARESVFTALLQSAVTDSSYLVRAIDGAHEGEVVAVWLGKTVESQCPMSCIGWVVLEITHEGEQGMPAVRVVGSTFDPIGRMADTFLPLYAIADPNWRSPLWHRNVVEWQMELREALQWVCREALEARRLERLAQYDAAQVSESVSKHPVLPPAPTVKGQIVEAIEEDPGEAVELAASTVPQSARPLKVEHIAPKPKHWTGGNNFYVSAGRRGVAYFVRTTEGGAKKLILHKVSDEHPLAPLLDGHRAIMVDVDPIMKSNIPEASGDLHDVRVARSVVQQYLRSVLFERATEVV